MMQVEHREFILVRANGALVRLGVCIALHLKSARSRGIQAGCERGLSPRSRLCVVDRVLLATLVCA